MANNMGLAILCISFVYSIFLNILFFTKKHIKTYETKMFSIMMVSNLIGIILEFSCIFSIYFLGTNHIIPIIANKLFLLYLQTFAILFAMYTAYITLIDGTEEALSQKHNKIRITALTIDALCCLLVLVLPVELYSNDGIMYSCGPAANVVYAVSAVGVFLCLGLMLARYKTIKKKKTITLFAYIIGCGITTAIQQTNPALTLATSMETFLIFLMYNTIENPDVKMVEQLNSAKDQADKANQAKTDFLSSMSHEIRTPLNAIMGFSDCIMNSSNIEEAKENAKDVVNASQTLLEIVNGILDISKIEAGKLEIVNSPYNAKKVFEELAKLITPKMKDKALDFTYHIAPDLPETLYGDHANIKKIITNLLSNACKYTDKGFVHYEVSCFNVNGVCKLIISVEDSGRGIKQENVNKLFTKFQRLDEDRNTTIEGTGLGLAITKQLVELMGGKIIVHTVYGEGSKFTVTIDQRIEEVKISEAEKVVNSNLNLTGKKILIVDDNVLNIKVATKLLQRYQATDITSFENGFACIDDIQNGSKYDVILLDDMMPKMSGVETLKKLKEIPNFNIPVVALTANAITGMKEKYLNEGFDNYLAKPIEKDELINVLNEILNTKQVEDKTEELEIFEYEEPVPEPSFDKEYLLQNNVDVDKALELLGDMDMYNTTMVDFVSELPEKWNRLVAYKDQSDMENYAIEVHSLKSDCKYLGFMTLADIAYQHELKSKENDLTYVQNNFDKLETEYKKVKRISTHYIENQNDII